MLPEKLLPLLQWVTKSGLRVVSRFKKNHQFHADQMQPQMIGFEVTIAHKNSKSLFLRKYLNFKISVDSPGSELASWLLFQRLQNQNLLPCRSSCFQEAFDFQRFYSLIEVVSYSHTCILVVNKEYLISPVANLSKNRAAFKNEKKIEIFHDQVHKVSLYCGRIVIICTRIIICFVIWHANRTTNAKTWFVFTLVLREVTAWSPSDWYKRLRNVS